MKLTNKEKLQMCLEHLNDGKSLSHICERYNYTDISKLKYWINLYKRHGKEIFVKRETKKYRRDTKLLAINRVENGESIRSVAVDLGLTEPAILGDWIKLYKNEGEQRIQDTYPRKSYLNEDERYKKTINKNLKEENERLKAEIDYLKKSQSLVKKLEDLTTKEKVEVVRELRTKYELKVLLEITNIPKSVYHYQINSIDNKINKYKEMEERIDYLYLKKHKKRIGYQRIYIELKNEGYIIGKNKVLKIMRKKGYTKQNKPKYYNSYEGDLGGVVENILNQDFKTTKPYEKAGTDVTMFSIREERVYLSPIIDFNSREILSYEVGTDAKVVKVINMLNKLKTIHKDNIKGMILQSDQGIQYQNSRYTDKLEELDIIQSMSRKGNCLDNSPTENFFGRMKSERVERKKIFTQMVNNSKSVVADELLFTATNEFFKDMNKEDIKLWADTCMEFVHQNLGYVKEQVLHSCLHLDEKTPHIHCVVIPLVKKLDKRTNTERFTISKKQYIKDKLHLSELQGKYHKRLTDKGFDLERYIKNSDNKHINIKQYEQITRKLNLELDSKNKRLTNAKSYKYLENENNNIKNEVKYLRNRNNKLQKENDNIISYLKAILRLVKEFLSILLNWQ